jgi:uncharacterized membrane protein
VQFDEGGKRMTEITVGGGAAPVPTGAATLAYVLFAVAVVSAIASHGLVVLAPLVGLAGIAGVIAAYVGRSQARGTWVASHGTWLIRTFWWSLFWGVIGGLTLVTLGIVLVGIPIAVAIFFATSIWGIYRVVRGFLLFKDSAPVPGM